MRPVGKGLIHLMDLISIEQATISSVLGATFWMMGPCQQPPLLPPPPLDMALFLQTTSPSRMPASIELSIKLVVCLQTTSNYDLQHVFQTVAVVQPIPQRVPCEWPGGDALKAVMKSRAAELTQSVSGVFAHTTSSTMLSEDTAIILETFGNVSFLFSYYQ